MSNVISGSSVLHAIVALLGLVVGGDCLAIGLTKILPADGNSGDWFGGALDLDGDTLVVGSQWHGTQPRGAAYVYRRTAMGWRLIDTLRPGDGQAAANFGNSVAIDGSTVVVVDYQHDLTTEMGQIGFAGAAYVFQESSDGWTQIAKLTAEDAMRQDYFGTAVGVHGNTVMVGGSKLGDLTETNRPTVYVFENAAGTWQERQKLTLSVDDGGLNASYGEGIAIEGDTALVSAWSLDSSRAGINSGAVFAYERTAEGWRETQVLRPSDPIFRGKFGRSIDLSGETAIIGRPAGGPAATGPFLGAAYIFERVNGLWTETARLQPSDGFTDDLFGSQVAISGNLAAVSAYGRDGDNVYLFKKWETHG